MKTRFVAILSVVFAMTSASYGASIYFVGAAEDDGAFGSDFAGWEDDGLIYEHLLDLGHDVIYQSGNNSSAQFANSVDLLIISSTLGSGSVRGKYHNIETPILQWEEALYHVQDGNMPITLDGGMANNGTDARATEVAFLNPDHPLSAGFEGFVEIADEPIAMPYASQISAEVISIAEHIDFSLATPVDEEMIRHVMTYLPKGAERADDTISPHHHVTFPIQDRDFGFLNDNGLALFDNTINFLLNDGEVDPPVGADCDFDANGVCDLVDLDELLYTGLSSGDLKYDLNASGSVDLDDRDALLIEIGSLPGDANGDGTTNAADLNALGSNWQKEGLTSWQQGDFDGNGVGNAADLNIVGGNWQKTAAEFAGAPLAATAAVPEPSSMGLILMAVLGMLGIRRK